MYFYGNDGAIAGGGASSCDSFGDGDSYGDGDNEGDSYDDNNGDCDGIGDGCFWSDDAHDCGWSCDAEVGSWGDGGYSDDISDDVNGGG